MLYTHLTKTNEPSITGYKIAVKLNGSYYSPATMMKYQIGEVEKPQPEDIRSYENLFVNVTNNVNTGAYDPNMVNRTSVFKELVDAQREFARLQVLLKDDVKDNLVILTMKISKTSGDFIYEGIIDQVSIVYAGNYISSFAEI